jgi:1,4-alpha-glucan branching enzyme
MGEEFGATTPFLYFCDFEPELAAAVRTGRRREFARFAPFRNQAVTAIPDPQAPATFLRSKLDWASGKRPEHKWWLSRYRELLQIRHDVVVPMLSGIDPRRSRFTLTGPRSLAVRWPARNGPGLLLLANLGAAPDGEPSPPVGNVVFTTGHTTAEAAASAWSATWMTVAGNATTIQP